MTKLFGTSIRSHQRAGLVIVLSGCLAAGTLSAVASISGAVVAPAIVVVEGSAKKVQHLEGGIVSETLVKNGDRVRQGDVIIRLQDTQQRASLQILKVQLMELEAQRARLIAERDSADNMPANDQANADSSIWQAQRRLLDARRDVREGKQQQLTERIAQLEQGAAGLTAQVDSKERQISLIQRELESINELREARLVTQNRWLALEREAARLDGERGQFLADISRLKVQVGETRLQLISIDQSFLSEVLTELREVDTKMSELNEKIGAITTRIDQMEVKAPSTGFIHKLTATTQGGVMAAGEVVAEVISDELPLILEAHVDAGSIDRLKVQQQSVIRFPASDNRATPEFEGTVTFISADARQDIPAQAPYFIVQVAPTKADELRNETFKPGMPAELLFKTGDRSVLSFLIKPFMDQMTKAMRE